MKVPLSWLREFVNIQEAPEAVGGRMSVRGLALEGLEAHRPRDGSEEDVVFDFDVTANRPDCLSIQGIAREVATAYGLPLNSRPGAEADPSSAAARRSLPIDIEEPDLCRRYVGAIAEVRVAPSPPWMQERLIACGVRPISNVVDVTNYVLLELGQPMHAFDHDRLAGPAIVVRRARPGETLTTLDGKARVLDETMLVIADAERATALAGVMGGADSEVAAATRLIVLESAWFKPQSVRSTSKRLGMRTEASYRFERGADLTVQAAAMERALTLLEQIGAGRRAGPVIDCCPSPYQPRAITVDGAGIDRLLGMRVPDADTERILDSLGFHVRALGGWHAAAPEAATSMGQIGSGWHVEVPPWRPDVQRPVDVIEEVGRHYGYEHLPTTFPPIDRPPLPSDPRVARDTRVRRGLLAVGFSEAISFAFIESAAAAPFLGDDRPVLLANPLTEKFTTLRPSLLPGLIDAVSHNRRHGRRDVQLFEIGTRFSPRGEARAAAGIWTGLATPDHWSGGRRDVDFFDVKGAVEQVCRLLTVTPRIEAAAVNGLVPGRAATVSVDGAVVGHVGQLSPEITEPRDVPASDAVYAFELDLDRMSAAAPRELRMAQALPRHPFVVRDVSILVDDGLSAESVRGTMRAANIATLVDVREFDRYQGKGIPDGKVSLSFRLTFQAPDRTLTDAEVQQAMDAIVGRLTHECGAIQR